MREEEHNKDWRDFTLGEISDEIDEMERTSYSEGLKVMLPRELYVVAKAALDQLKSLMN